MAIHQFYADFSTCSHEHLETTIRAINLKSWNKTIDSIAKALFSGSIKPIDLHKGLITKTYKELNDGAALGYGVKYTKDRGGKLLQKHLFKFSVVKTYHQLVEMQGFLVDDAGKLRTYADFKKKVDTVHKNYNQKYLQVEYRTAKRSAQAARQWGDFEADKDLFPNLVYRTVGDDAVRDEHQKLDKIIRPIGDKFWDTHYPPNGWQCRCSVQQSTSTEITKKVPNIKLDKGFSNNVGKTGQAFDEKGHPYFTMPKEANKAVQKYLDGEGK